MNLKLNIVFKCPYCLYMQLIKTLCEAKYSMYLEIYFRILVFFQSMIMGPDFTSVGWFYTIYVTQMTYFNPQDTKNAMFKKFYD